ncbi:hypothetical protein BD410DRAFT_325666 [Rickenella mellea]|uniref:BTB domain-containing protein n=1 Tax=Rickenella mellea TaxID=50990 RepID=A0A4Y7QK25_9AGAM|nr:hypothetical protein BD410DRAFT_325666 [Rickenella mellea]
MGTLTRVAFQTFVLDLRSFPTDRLIDPVLSPSQGPALLATNNELFKADDWKAIRAINDSSKAGDETTTGKFGLGFRSCYHITDTPQILSGPQLYMLDPHHRMPMYPGGFCLDTRTDDRDKYSSQFDAFAAVLPQTGLPAEYNGTAIRLPLRLANQAKSSEIKKTPTSVSDVRKMFEDFAAKELPEALLFLKNITSISLSEVDEDGMERVLAKASIEISDVERRSRNRGRQAENSPLDLVIHVEVEGTKTTRHWLVWHFVEEYKLVEDLMAKNLGQSVKEIGEMMAADKLLPHIALAIALPSRDAPTSASYAPVEGRLFTLLPLPIDTGFPLHLHGVLALTSSRQNLRNYHDVAPGSREEFLITWNRLVFSQLAPKAWAGVLVYLTKKPGSLTPFDLWPKLSVSNGGDQHYWESLPHRLLECTKTESIWPVAGGIKEVVRYLPLESLLVVKPGALDDRLVDALKLCEIFVTHPPERVYSLIAQSDELSTLILSPASVRKSIDAHISVFKNLTAQSRRVICDYLATASDLALLLSLPLIPTVDGRHISITLRETYAYTLVTETESELFAAADRDLLSLKDMSSQTQSLLLQTSKVVLLTPSKVVIYLKTIFGRFSDVGANNIYAGVKENEMSWLIKFWKWLSEWGQKSEFLGDGALAMEFRKMHLLPLCPGNVIRRCSAHVIRHSDLSSRLLPVFETLKIPILHPEVPSDGSVIKCMLRSPTDALFLLSEFAHHTNRFPALDNSARLLLHKHFTSCFAINRPSLNASQEKTLRLLPIFPLLSCGERCSQEISYDVAPVSSIFVNESVEVIPHVNGMPFVNAELGHELRLALKRDIMPEKVTLEMAILNWSQQNRGDNLARLLIDRIMHRMSDLSEEAGRALRTLRFVTVGQNDTELRPPISVVDPASPIASLFDNNELVLPTGAFALDRPGSYLQQLRNYGMILTKLTPEIILDRVDAISNSYKVLKDKARKALTLLRLMDEQFYAATAIPTNIAFSIATRKWLPASGHLYTARDCWDKSSRDIRLCDLALNIVDLRVVSSSLRKALGWDKISNDTLIQQFINILDGSTPKTPSLTVKKNRAERIISLLRELADRYDEVTLEDETLDGLLGLIGNRPWVPISEQHCVDAECAMLDRLNLGPTFQCVYSSLLDRPPTVTLLRKMGIPGKPSTDSLRAELHAMSLTNQTAAGGDSIQNFVRIAIAILEEICLSSQLDKSELLIPTTDSTLRAAKNVIYNDVGVALSDLPDGKFAAHPTVSPALAAKLGLVLLSDEQFFSDPVGFRTFHISEDLSTRINGVLKDYDIEYASNEWVANADDADATQVSLLVDEQVFHGSRLLAPTMSEFNGSPALVIHNDAVFKESDFEGLADIGVGGKGAAPDKIGRFGLGALSFYHFTELPMIVSADCVLFLDPSRRYLPKERRGHDRLRPNGIKIPLESCRIRHPDQLQPLDGRFGFSISTSYYDGTIIRLPLRTVPQATMSKLSHRSFSPVDIIHLVLSKFYLLATQSLFFSKINCIKAERRDPGGQLSQMWCVSGQRCVSEDNVVVIKRLDLELRNGLDTSSERWLVTAAKKKLDTKPDFVELMEKHRLSTPSLSLALRLPERQNDLMSAESRLFATLPLPIATSLPIHLHATWILSNDRRSIRYDAPDANGNRPLDSAFNEYLLTELCPTLYFDTMELVVSKHPELSYCFWPTTAADPLSLAITKAFYRFFISAPHHICRTVTNEWMAPRDVLFHVSRSTGVKEMFTHLKLRDFVCQLPVFNLEWVDWNALRTDTPSQVAELLRQHHKDVCKILTGAEPLPKVSNRSITNVLKYLVDGDQNMLGIPLLQLGNGKVETFEKSDTKLVFATYFAEISIYFGPHRIVGQAIPTTGSIMDYILKSDINVRKLDLKGVTHLLRQCEDAIVPSPQKVNPRLPDQWYKDILEFLAKLQFIKWADVSNLPLIPTLNERRIVSLEYAQKPEVLRQSLLRHWACPIEPLISLGVTIINDGALSFLGSEFPDMDGLNALLNGLRSSPHRTSTLNSQVEERDWKALATWFMDRTYNSNAISALTQPNVNLLTMLPLFQAKRGKDPWAFTAACDLLMLPERVHMASFTAIHQYLPPTTRFATYSYNLRMVLRTSALKDRGLELSAQNFLALLNIPGEVPVSDDEHYLQLLQLFVHLHGDSYAGVLIPDQNRVVRAPGSLYDHRVPVFAVALQGHPELFMHEQFRSDILMVGLLSLGVHGTIGWNELLKCATTLHEDSNRAIDIAERARGFWEYFNSGDASSVIHRQLPFEWVSNLRFVPAHARRHQHDHLAGFANPLPSVISPAQAALRTHWSAVWTQRATFEQDPSPLLLANMPDLGTPSAAEVVAHLVALATVVASHHPSDRRLLPDIRATYSWLSNNIETAKPLLLNHKDSFLWLNVDDPAHDPWVWRSAEQLVFAMSFDGEGGHYDVKESLSDFHTLLLAAGAKAFMHVDISEEPEDNSKPSHIEIIRRGFDSLREDGQLFDIQFKIGGEIIKAHKALLAAVIEHFRAALTGGYKESGNTGSADDTLPEYKLPDNTSAFAVRSVIDFVYTGSFSAPKCGDVEEAEVALAGLLDLLDLSNMWNIEDLHVQVQIMIVNLKLIRLETWDAIYDRAKSCHADRLADACVQTQNYNAWASQNGQLVTDQEASDEGFSNSDENVPDSP